MRPSACPGYRSRATGSRVVVAVAGVASAVLGAGPASLSAPEWHALAEDADSMLLLHRESWRRWPVEAWDLGREEPQLPPEAPRPVLAQNVSVSDLPAEGLERSDGSLDELEADEESEPASAATPGNSGDPGSSSIRPATLHPGSRRSC